MSNLVFLASGAAEIVVAVSGLAGDLFNFGPGLNFLFPNVKKTEEGEMSAALAYTALAAFGGIPYIYMYCSPVSKAAMMPAALGGLIYNMGCAGATVQRLLTDNMPLPGPAPASSGSRHFASGVFWAVWHTVTAVGFVAWMIFKKDKKKAD